MQKAIQQFRAYTRAPDGAARKQLGNGLARSIIKTDDDRYLRSRQNSYRPSIRDQQLGGFRLISNNIYHTALWIPWLRYWSLLHYISSTSFHYIFFWNYILMYSLNVPKTLKHVKIYSIQFYTQNYISIWLLNTSCNSLIYLIKNRNICIRRVFMGG